MPVSDRNGNMVGYMLVDKNPNDAPNPGDPGFEEWNYGPIQVTNESGELVGHMQSVSPGGIQMFEPLTSTAVNENGQAAPALPPNSERNRRRRQGVEQSKGRAYPAHVRPEPTV